MKKQALAVVASLLLLSSCRPTRPETIAEKFLTAMVRMDFETAEGLATPESKTLLKNVETLTATQVTDSARQRLAESRIRILKTEVKGDEAVVTYAINENGAPLKLFMKKENEKWLAEPSKIEELGKSGADPLQQPQQ